jgi:hypothetical protein
LAGDRETIDRADAVRQAEHAERTLKSLIPDLNRATAAIELQRQELMIRRTNRKQMENLAEGEKRAAEIREGRRAQQMLDDWFGRRRGIDINEQENRFDKRSESQQTE